MHEKGYNTFDPQGYPTTTEGWTIDGMKALHDQPKWQEWIVKTYEALESNDMELDYDDKRIPGLPLHGIEHPNTWISSSADDLHAPYHGGLPGAFFIVADSRMIVELGLWTDLRPHPRPGDSSWALAVPRGRGQTDFSERPRLI